MACFLVSAAEAVVVKTVEKSEEKKELMHAENAAHAEPAELRIPMSVKLKWLSTMLWGGAALLMFEHIWHGEIVPWFPFLTAASDPADLAEMLREMATVGVCMALLVTLVWAGMCIAADAILKRASREERDGVRA